MESRCCCEVPDFLKHPGRGHTLTVLQTLENYISQAASFWRDSSTTSGGLKFSIPIWEGAKVGASFGKDRGWHVPQSQPRSSFWPATAIEGGRLGLSFHLSFWIFLLQLCSEFTPPCCANWIGTKLIVMLVGLRTQRRRRWPFGLTHHCHLGMTHHSTVKISPQLFACFSYRDNEGAKKLQSPIAGVVNLG